MNLIFMLNIFILLVNIQTTETRKCYVCGIGSEEPFTHNSKSQLEYPMDVPLSCDQFELSTNLDKFIFTCPMNYVGCITQTDGTDVIRTCDSLAIDDCQTANGVEYCYCNTDLCNIRKERSTKTKHETLYDDDDTSDIDEFESSGHSSIDAISDETLETSVTVSTTSTTIPIIVPPTITSTKLTTSTTTTSEAIIANKGFATQYDRTHTVPTTTESTNATNRNFVKCSKVIFIMQIVMLIFL